MLDVWVTRAEALFSADQCFDGTVFANGMPFSSFCVKCRQIVLSLGRHNKLMDVGAMPSIVWSAGHASVIANLQCICAFMVVVVLYC